MRTRVLLVVFALVASTAVAAAAQEDEIARALGPGAERLANGHWRIPLDDGTSLLTHGPDWASSHGSSMDLFDVERPVACATDYYQHVLYGRPQSAPNRIGVVKPQIQAAMRRMNAVLNEESLTSGNIPADYKVKCDINSEIQVDSFTSRSNDFQTIASEARNAGFTASNADYTIFYDGTLTGICGTGSINPDERLVEDNFSNNGGDYAVAYVNCWDDETAMHENGHNQGAVQANAPYSTGWNGWHCNDENDVMCYRDGGPQNQTIVNRCNDRIHFDCGNDTYFDSVPEEGEYLASNWNIGSRLNRFIQFGTPLSNPPVAAMWFSCSGFMCQFTDKSTDDGTIASWRWQFWEYASSTEQNPTKTFYTSGTFFVTLTVRDNHGGYGMWTQRIVIPSSGDPDPQVSTLTNNAAVGKRNGTVGRWEYFKIFVPEGRPNLTATSTGPACYVVACQTDLDLYIHAGDRPTLGAYVCKASQTSNNETCVVPTPATGWWYVGVYVAFAPPALPPPVSSVNLYAVNYTVKAQY